MSDLVLPTAVSLPNPKEKFVSPCNSPIKVSKAHKILSNLRQNPLCFSPERKLSFNSQQRLAGGKLSKLTPLPNVETPPLSPPRTGNPRGRFMKVCSPQASRHQRSNFLKKQYNHSLSCLITSAPQSKCVHLNTDNGEMTYILSEGKRDSKEEYHPDRIPEIEIPPMPDYKKSNKENKDNNKSINLIPSAPLNDITEIITCEECIANEQFTSLHLSIINHHDECFNKILNNSSNNNYNNLNELELCDKVDHRTAIHLCCIYGYSDYLEKLINKGIRVTYIDNYGFTPLHLACINNHLECIKILLNYIGEWIEIGDNYGNTVLHYTVYQSLYEATEMILIQQQQLQQQLQQQNNNNNEDNDDLSVNSDNDENECKNNNIIIENNSNNNNKIEIIKSNKDGITPLHLVTKIDILKLLIKYDSNFNICITDYCKRTPLHIVCLRRDKEMLDFILRLSTIYRILNFQDIDGNTALHIACKVESYECIESLLKINASHLLLNQNKETAVDIIMKSKNIKCIDLVNQYVNRGLVFDPSKKHESKEEKEDDKKNNVIGWSEHTDEESGAQYWYNEITGESTWYKPQGFVNPSESKE